MTQTDPLPRYAIYAAPDPADRLWRFGSSVIGYDAVSGAEPEPPPAVTQLLDWHAWTDEPRRYGFHGTLKAPFHLTDEWNEADLLAAVSALASGRSAFRVSSLEVAQLNAFLALVPGEHSPELEHLSAACVEHLDPARAPLSGADRRRRLGAQLSERQAHNLDRWGYPYVFDEFRFHMTLTGAIPAEQRSAALTALRACYAPIAQGLAVEALCVFRQENRAARFRVVARLPLAGGQA